MDLVVDSSLLPLIQDHCDYLEANFGTSLTLVEQSGGESKIRLCGDKAFLAKNYVESLCQQRLSASPSSSSPFHHGYGQYPDKLFHKNGSEFEGSEILILQEEESRKALLSARDYMSNSSSASSWDTTESSKYLETSPSGHQSLYRTVSDCTSNVVDKRKKLESEDSSYDSDNEIAVLSKSHDDVSRTFSDTLASEFAEYVSISKKDEREDVVLADPNYNGKVEFALRLGYAESLLQKALKKLGPSAGQDKILAELIRLQKSKPINSEIFSERRSSVVEESLQSKNLNEENSEDPFLPIVIDGSNVAMSHGNKEKFSCRGIQLCVNWFKDKGHQNITVFVPRWRKESSKPESPITEQHILTELEKERILTYTPSRQVGGRRVVCHDDRYILNLAAETGAIVVSNDNYRELISEKSEYKDVIANRILMYSFVNDRFMPPDDPLGKNGPTLSVFLRKTSNNVEVTPQQPCPYGKKCTYGNKCKYYHAERGNQPQKSITDKLKEHSSLRISEVRVRGQSRDSSPGDPLTRAMSINLPPRVHEKQQLCRTQSNIPSRIFDRSQNPLHHQQHYHSHRPKQQHIVASSQDPYNNKSLSFENLPPSTSSAERLWSNQLNLNIPPYADLSVPPPPPPRTPWQQSTTPTTTSPSKRDPSYSDSNSHLKLSRQLSLNPSYDVRLQRFLFPPPFPHHQNHESVSRIASAPERVHRGFAPPVAYVTPETPSLVHKSVSDSFQPDSMCEWSQERNFGPVGSRKQNNGNNRQHLFVHLKAIFPENQVLRAMSALPGETDGQKICEYIINMNSQK